MQRIGFGFDSHRLVGGKDLMLGGVRIDHALGLAGHSDADAVLHAITDAILGAIGADDIGQQFPDTDPRWAEADSSEFIKRAVEMAAEQDCRVGNCDVTILAEQPKLLDVTILAEQPKLAPHKAAMRQRIAELLGVCQTAVAVKAKTGEGMGFVGRGEGIAALAAVLLIPD